MKGYFRIGEVSELLNLTPQALRYYEQQGIVVPEKSENGTRYYSPYNVHRLISFKKYRNVDLSIQEIVDYMRNRPLADRDEWFRGKINELLAQSQKLKDQAMAITFYLEKVHDTIAQAGKFREKMRPDFYMQTFCWEDSAGLTPETMRNMRAYIDAMPATCLCFTAEDGSLAVPRYRLGANDQVVHAGNLPLKDTLRLAPVPCVSTCLVCPSDYEIQPALGQAVTNAQRLGYRLNEKEPILCILITADTSTPEYQTFILAYLPIMA